MLDNAEDISAEEPIVEEAPPEAIEPEEVVISFEGDPAPEETEPETPLIKQLRQKIKEEAKRAREATARLAELDAAKEPDALEEKPTIESCGFDDAAYEKKLEAWFSTKAERDAQAKAKADAEKASQAEWNNRISTYEEQKTALKKPDFTDAEDAVKSSLTVQQQAIIVRNIENPAAFVYALGLSPAKIEELKVMRDLDKFTAAVVRLEGKLTMTPRKPPPPETRLPGSSAGQTSSVKLESLKKEAQRTGDYGAYFAAKRQAEGLGAKV